MSNHEHSLICPAWIQHDPDAFGSEALRWSGKAPPPKVGSLVNVQMNALGPGVVKGYFEAAGFLGVVVYLAHPPEWFLKQSNGNYHAKIFGCDLECYYLVDRAGGQEVFQDGKRLQFSALEEAISHAKSTMADRGGSVAIYSCTPPPEVLVYTTGEGQGRRIVVKPIKLEDA